MHPYASTTPPAAATRPETAPGITALPVRTTRTRPGPTRQDTSLILGPVETAPAAARATLRLSLRIWGLTHLTDDAEAICSDSLNLSFCADSPFLPFSGCGLREFRGWLLCLRGG